MAEADAPRTLHHGTDYREHRAAAYPPIADQLDAIIKAFAALAERGEALPPEMADLIQECRDVKALYRKPQA